MTVKDIAKIFPGGCRSQGETTAVYSLASMEESMSTVPENGVNGGLVTASFGRDYH